MTWVLISSGNGTKKQGESTYYGQYVDDKTQLHQRLDIMDSSEGWISSVFDLVRFLVHFDGGGVKTDLIKGSLYDIMVEPSEVDPNPYKFAKGLMLTLALKYFFSFIVNYLKVNKLISKTICL